MLVLVVLVVVVPTAGPGVTVTQTCCSRIQVRGAGATARLGLVEGALRKNASPSPSRSWNFGLKPQYSLTST